MYAAGYAPYDGTMFCGYPPDYDPCSAIDEIIARVRPDIEALKAWRAARELKSPAVDPTRPLRFEPRGDAERRMVAAIDREIKARKRAAAEAERERRRVEALERKRQARAARDGEHRRNRDEVRAERIRRLAAAAQPATRTCRCGREFQTRPGQSPLTEWCVPCRRRAGRALGKARTVDAVLAWLDRNPTLQKSDPLALRKRRREIQREWSARDRARKRAERAPKEREMAPSWLVVLAAVRESGGLSVSEAAVRLGWSPMTAKNVMTRMRAAGVLAIEGWGPAARSVLPRREVTAPVGEVVATMAGGV